MPLAALAHALAHAGHHDPESHGLLHALTEPDHLLAAAALVALALTSGLALRRRSSRGTSDVKPSTPSPSGRGQG